MHAPLFQTLVLCATVGVLGHADDAELDVAPDPQATTPEPVVRRVDVFSANATTGTYWPCGSAQGVEEGEVCVPCEPVDQGAMLLRKKIRQHWTWVRVRGATITPDDGRRPRPLNVLAPTWNETGLSFTSLDGAVYRAALRDVPLETTHRQVCRYVPAPFVVTPAYQVPEKKLLCARVRNRDAELWWIFWRSRMLPGEGRTP